MTSWRIDVELLEKVGSLCGGKRHEACLYASVDVLGVYCHLELIQVHSRRKDRKNPRMPLTAVEPLYQAKLDALSDLFFEGQPPQVVTIDRRLYVVAMTPFCY